MKVELRNLGTVNKNVVTLGNLRIWFSYETPVGYQLPLGGRVVRENDWSTTTGKLLNELEPDKKKRISGSQFEAQLQAILDTIPEARPEMGVSDDIPYCSICGGEHFARTHTPNAEEGGQNDL